MSADNAIIVVSNINDKGNEEFRVAYTQAIDNLTSENPILDVYLALIFNDSQVFENRQEAINFAKEEEKKYEFLEYGIVSIDFETPFPDLTENEANVLFDKHFGFKS
jgi:hypothetical protein